MDKETIKAAKAHPHIVGNDKPDLLCGARWSGAADEGWSNAEGRLSAGGI
jgi:hypothetical protein